MAKPVFVNDYCHGAHPEILRALNDTNSIGYEGYGCDEWCAAAKKEIHKYICPNTDIHFFVGGTQVNYVSIELMLTRPFHTVICPESGHIHVHESGSIEHTGRKIHLVPSFNGKLSAEDIEADAARCHLSEFQEHITHPKAVYISYPTETGTIYSKDELLAIRKVCDKYGLYLFIDGARLGYGLASPDCDLTIADICSISDMFYIGGTKCGALFGEALVISNDELKPGVRNYMKMNGAMLAKGWLLGLQYYTLFKDGLYFDITSKAIDYAQQLKKAFADVGVSEYGISQTNQLFYALDRKIVESLEAKLVLERQDYLDGDKILVRFCTAWSTTQDEIDETVRIIAEAFNEKE